jgi:undecaprenyl-diphosphatase
LRDRDAAPPEARTAWALVLGTLPAAAVGLVIKAWIAFVARGWQVVAVNAAVYGLLLLVADRIGAKRRDLAELGRREGLLIGCAQALALVPGVSRSGITLLAAMALGLRRDAAARFSFLLSIPAIAGAGVFELRHVMKEPGAALALGVALATAAVTGYAAIAWLLRFLRTRTTIPFVIYRLALGGVLLTLIALGWRG